MARFWGEATDWTVHEVTDDSATLRSAKGVGPFLEFLRSPEPKTVPTACTSTCCRITRRQAGRRDRLRDLGAADLDLGQGDVPWTCLTHPEGHEFCVLATRPPAV